MKNQGTGWSREGLEPRTDCLCPSAHPSWRWGCSSPRSQSYRRWTLSRPLWWWPHPRRENRRRAARRGIRAHWITCDRPRESIWQTGEFLWNYRISVIWREDSPSFSISRETKARRNRLSSLSHRKIYHHAWSIWLPRTRWSLYLERWRNTSCWCIRTDGTGWEGSLRARDGVRSLWYGG